MRRPLGCMTFSALAAALLAAIVIAVAASVTGNGIFSPGALSGVARGAPIDGVSSHADLERRCDACHATLFSGDRMADRCLACHTTVQEEIASGDGLHGLLAPVDDCRGCHTDHRGATAALTLADPADFPHERTGYSLRAHPLRAEGGDVSCLDCHPASPTSFTPPACLSCHEGLDQPYMAEHVETFGTACLNCHDGIDSYGASFDHAVYPLTGGHAEAECGGCHQGSTTLEALRATTTECVACHAADDIHDGRLGTSCEECHTPATWADATIDHDLTRFALVGRHVDALCESCHVDRQWTGIGQTCRDCHQVDDPHRGQFTGDCAPCHAPTGWEDVTFDHAQTGFALTGGHAKPACAACHPDGRYVGTPTSCIACHAADDRHDGAFGKDCAACHKTTTWDDWTFDHDRSDFPLTGAHRNVSCQGCHKGGTFAGTPTACAACHARPASHGSVLRGSCGSCHTTRAWTPASYNGPHPFPMRHGGAGTCAACHPSSLTSYSCARCHSRTEMADHHKEVSGYSANACVRCHPTGDKEEDDD
jgi:hypothetical protein